MAVVGVDANAVRRLCVSLRVRFLEFAVHELLLPDAGMVHGRFIVSAWEFGLDGIQDSAVKLLSLAVEVRRSSDAIWWSLCVSQQLFSVGFLNKSYLLRDHHLEKFPPKTCIVSGRASNSTRSRKVCKTPITVRI